MNVQELIQNLSRFDPTLRVAFQDPRGIVLRDFIHIEEYSTVNYIGDTVNEVRITAGD